MGHRLHVAKKYDIEYALTDGFNHEVEEFHNLMTSLGISYTGDEYDDEFEINKYEFIQGIDKLKNIEEQVDEKQIRKALGRLNEDLPEIIQIMELYLERSDQDNDFLYFSFF